MPIYPLHEGEELLWWGKPQRRQKWFPEHTLLVIAAGAVIPLAVLVATGIAQVPNSSAFVVLAVLLGTVGYQQLTDRRIRSRTTSYLVTSQRIVFVVSSPSGAEFRWIWLRLMQLPPEVQADAEGVGTITFGGRWWRWQLRQHELRGAWAPTVPELREIADAPWVADLIRQAQTRLAAAPAPGTYTQSP